MLTRRRFLSHSCALGATSATVASSLLSLGLARHASAADADDYRALVCILLAGGNDSYNMLVPHDTSGYAAYAAIRADLALPRDELLPLATTDAEGRSFALHPGMPGVQRLYADGKAAILANVGTLLEPMSPAGPPSDPARTPLGLFSHSDQIQQWQTAVVDARIAEGWGGRIADLLEAGNPANGISMNISLSGNNVFQSGQVTAPYAISSVGDGAPALRGYGEAGRQGRFIRGAVDGLLAPPRQHLLRREYADRLASAIEAQAVFSEALANGAALPTEFSDSAFSAALRQVARVISARHSLGARRQTFFITVGGWDHHDEVLANQAAMLPEIDAGIAEFHAAMEAMGLAGQVTSFTTSDFGRTLTSNGRGSDHGWGGHHLIVGGAVRGGAIYGRYPDIHPHNPLDVGRGIYAPTTAVDEYFAELALWFGVSAGDLREVLPNIGSFYTPVTGGRPIGFLS